LTLQLKRLLSSAPILQTFCLLVLIAFACPLSTFSLRPSLPQHSGQPTQEALPPSPSNPAEQSARINLTPKIPLAIVLKLVGHDDRYNTM
jgi:hypothetical protein